MSDLDFEELDRAVKSAIGDLAEDTTARKPAPDISTEGSTGKLTQKPLGSTLTKKTATKSSVERLRSLDSFSAPAKAQVKKSNTTNSSSRPFSGEDKPMIGVTNSNYVARSVQSTAGLDIIRPTKLQNIEGLSQNDEQASAVAFDFKANDDSGIEDDIKEDLVIETDSIAEIDKPKKETPFIENAKVEKRPLGAFSNVEKIEPIKNTVDTEGDSSLEVPTYVGGVDEASELPQELHSDILAVESTGTTPKEKPLSIPESTSKDEKQNTNIHTGESYNKPLAFPAKKKSGWLAVTLIVLLLILGAVLGLAIYYFNYMV